MNQRTQVWKVWIALVAMITMVASACGDTPSDDTPASGDGDVGVEDADEGDVGCEPTVLSCPADSCGMVDNGCGEDLDCGECDESCEPTKTTCGEGDCGMVDNGCGESLDCGQCEEPCEPTVSVCGADDCGMVDNGCGENLDCGECEEVCEPTVVSCPVDSCGTVDNGCGESLDCGECNCVNGVAAEEVCGACGLGVRVCGAGETGDGVCEAPNVPGLTDGNCQAILYVVPQGADGDGSRNSPMSDLQEALDNAQTRFPSVVVVAHTPQESPVTGPVFLNDGVMVSGGYRASDWRRQPDGRTTIRTPAMEGDLEGMVAVDITTPTVVEGFNVQTADATTPGASTIGVKVQGSSGLTLRRVSAQPGQAADGEDGPAGSAGSPGPAGANGTFYEQANGTWSSALGGGMSGGDATNSGCSDSAQRGADGGRGYLQPTTSTTLDPTAGGAKGSATGGEVGNEFYRAGRPGGHGADSSSHGSAGLPGVASGDFDNGVWTSNGDGEAGSSGGHGGGGAGGGGSWKATPSSIITGSGGGGGGAAGCGGAGGEGGMAGGSSFGLVVLNSELVVEQGAFDAGQAGNGGQGGAGGQGGEGGEGGYATSVYCYSEGNCHSFGANGGGRGGRGGDGANGGPGAGGAGGDSYGAYCADATLTAGPQVGFSAGSGGLGGLSPGHGGPAGRSMESFGCQ